MDLEERPHGRVYIVGLTDGGVIDLDGVLSSLYIQYLCALHEINNNAMDRNMERGHLLREERAELFCVQRGTHDDNFEGIKCRLLSFTFPVGWLVSVAHDRLEVGEKNVGSQSALVGLINNDNAVSGQEGIG